MNKDELIEIISAKNLKIESLKDGLAIREAAIVIDAILSKFPHIAEEGKKVTAEEFLGNKNIKDTLFHKGEWKKKGLSELLTEFIALNSLGENPVYHNLYKGYASIEEYPVLVGQNSREKMRYRIFMQGKGGKKQMASEITDLVTAEFIRVALNKVNQLELPVENEPQETSESVNKQMYESLCRIISALNATEFPMNVWEMAKFDMLVRLKEAKEEAESAIESYEQTIKTK